MSPVFNNFGVYCFSCNNFAHMKLFSAHIIILTSRCLALIPHVSLIEGVASANIFAAHPSSSPMRYFQDRCSLIGWPETIRGTYLFPGEPKRIAETWCGNDIWMYAKITEASPRTVSVESLCRDAKFFPSKAVFQRGEEIIFRNM